MKPLIGVTADIDDGSRFSKRYAGKIIVHLWDAYLQAVRDAGGVPVLIAPARDSGEISLLLKRLDGILISGGAFDVPPSFYGEKIIPGARVKPKPGRATFERRLVQDAVKAGKPVLGICGGHQIINVAFGGSLIQDIPLQCKTGTAHNTISGKPVAMHSVDVEPDTVLARALFSKPIKSRKRITVNSFHHQAVKKIGRGLRATASAQDGLIEAIEAKKGFVIGVQWHPERLYREKSEQLRLLEQFIKAAKS
jgi:putative glutamine amidotransferase